MVKIFTGCIYNFHNNKTHISVMSRHTLNDGVTNDPDITSASYDEWMPELGPPGEIIAPYLRREIGWDDYKMKYVDFLRTDATADIVKNLAQKSLEEKIILLCKKKKDENYHRNLLAEECRIYQPSLEIIHL